MMTGDFDSAVTTGPKHKRTTMGDLADLLRTGTTHRHAGSIRHRMGAAKLSAVKDLDAFLFDDTSTSEGLARSLDSSTHLNWLIMSIPMNTVTLLGDKAMPSRRELDRMAVEAVRPFISAYGGVRRRTFVDR